MTQTPAVKVEALEKIYRGNGKAKPVLALENVDLTIPRGSIFGLLGPNGAGKSTFINILAGLVRKTSGSVEIWGFDIDRHPRNSRNSIGVVPQELFIDPFFTPFETLELQAGLYGVPKSRRRSLEILHLVRLVDKADAYSRTLSGGMKRRLLVAKAMVHSPPILVLDEPTAGVDIELRQQLWESVRRLHASGVTIILTTHYLEEAEQLCDTIAIINHGRVVACEATDSLLSHIDEKELVFKLDEPLDKIPVDLDDFHTQLASPTELIISFSKSDKSVGEILDRVSAAGLKVRDLKTCETDLEDIFLQLTRAETGDDTEASRSSHNG